MAKTHSSSRHGKLVAQHGCHPPRDGRAQALEFAIADEPDFYAELDERLGLREEGEIDPQTREIRFRDAIEIFGMIWDFCFENGKGKLVTEHTPETFQIVLRRFLVVTLMYRSKLMPSENLRSLGPKLGVSRVPVSKIGIEAAARFQCKSRVQKPSASIPNYAKAAKKGHKKRKLNAKARPNKIPKLARKPNSRK